MSGVKTTQGFKPYQPAYLSLWPTVPLQMPSQSRHNVNNWSSNRLLSQHYERSNAFWRASLALAAAFQRNFSQSQDCRRNFCNEFLIKPISIWIIKTFTDTKHVHSLSLTPKLGVIQGYKRVPWPSHSSSVPDSILRSHHCLWRLFRVLPVFMQVSSGASWFLTISPRFPKSCFLFKLFQVMALD